MSINKEETASVKDYGVFYDQNWQHRRKMEDAHLLQVNFCNDETAGVFAIYDGHGKLLFCTCN